MNCTKVLPPRQFQKCFVRFFTTRKSIKNVTEKRNENASFNKNKLLYNYAKKTNSNKHFMSMPDALNFWLKIPQDKIEAIKESSDYILQAVILLDDVQDGAQYRRSLPSANRIYGAPWSVTASEFCVVAAMQKLADQNVAGLELFCEHIMSALDGMALDLYWRDTFQCPTEDEYKAVVLKKISSFYQLQLGLMQQYSQNRTDYRELLNTLGIYYQIRDEYLNLVKLEALDTKSCEKEHSGMPKLMFCEDFTEGRFTWIVIHALNSSEGPTIRRILVQRPTDVKIKEYCLSLLEKVGSLEYTRQTLRELDTDLRIQLYNLGGNPLFLAYLDELYNWNHL